MSADPANPVVVGIRQPAPVPVTLPSSGGTVGYELLAHIELAPGRYSLRISADSAATVAQTSAATPSAATTPDFLNEPLSLSDVSIGVMPGIVSGPKGALAALVPVVPTTRREFARGDKVTAFLRAYQGGKGAPKPVTLHARIVDGNDANAVETTATLGPERFATDRAAGYSLDVPVARLRPGPHLLLIEAKVGDKTVRRDVRFEVR